MVSHRLTYDTPLICLRRWRSGDLWVLPEEYKWPTTAGDYKLECKQVITSKGPSMLSSKSISVSESQVYDIAEVGEMEIQ